MVVVSDKVKVCFRMNDEREQLTQRILYAVGEAISGLPTSHPPSHQQPFGVLESWRTGRVVTGLNARERLDLQTLQVA